MRELLNPENLISTITDFLADHLRTSRLSGYVVGLSGGIDSAVSASLAVRSVGADKLLAVMMPYRASSEDSLRDAQMFAAQLGVEQELIDISPMIDAYYEQINASNSLRAGNKMARERMSILFDLAHQTDRLVLGTGNRTEFCLGYTTLFGDSACSVNPIGELYKTDVRLLAENLGIPESIGTKPPTADLWQNQTDEGEIGVTYDVIDRLLMRIIEDGVTSLSQLTGEGFEASAIKRVVTLVNNNEFKRRLPAVASLGRKQVPLQIRMID